MDTLVIPNGPDALAGETRIAVGPTTPLDMVRGETRVVIKSGKHVQLFNLHGGIYFAGTFTGSVTFDPHQLPHVVLKHAAGAPPKNRKKTLPQEEVVPAPDPPAPVKQKATKKKSKKAPVEPVAAEVTLEKAQFEFEYARAEAAELAAAAAAAAVTESDKPAKVRKPRTQEQKDAANARRRQQRLAKAAAPTTVDPMEED